jgi:hypothetical protein
MNLFELMCTSDTITLAGRGQETNWKQETGNKKAAECGFFIVIRLGLPSAGSG